MPAISADTTRRIMNRVLKIYVCTVAAAALSLIQPIGANAFSCQAHSGDDPPKDPTLVMRKGVDYKVTVYDEETKAPISLALVTLRQYGNLVGEKETGPSGVAEFKYIAKGNYELSVHSVGFNDVFQNVIIDKAHLTKSIYMTILTFKEQVVTGKRITPVTTFNMMTDNQVFSAGTYHAPPTAGLVTLVQQNLMGAARGTTGAMHIRGQHGEYTYYIDGIPISLGVMGSLNSIVNTKVVNRATFMDGAWPAEYGGQLAAVINLQNRVPPGGFHLDFSTYGGSLYAPNSNDTLGSRVGAFKSLNSNGQSLALSDHFGSLGVFVSGSRQETFSRIEPPVPQIFHDHGFDYFLYGKIDYLFDDGDYLTSNLNWSNTVTQIPYSPLGAVTNDIQNTTNAFQTLSYYHTFSSEENRESKLFAGAYLREGGLLYTPGPGDSSDFQYANNPTNYVLGENRGFTTLGTRIVYDQRLSSAVKYVTGLDFNNVWGKEDYSTTTTTGIPGPSDDTNFQGSNFGIFAQTTWSPLDWSSFDIGLRYDQQVQPNTALQNQVSPRIKWNILFDPANTVYLYYGRVFMPILIEGLHAIASSAAYSGLATLPQRSDWYEAGYLHDFGFGLRMKADAYYEYASPGLNDETLGSTAIDAEVNVQTVHTTGIELGLSFENPSTPFSGYINTALSHAYGSGLVTGGFLPISSMGSVTDMDHDQRLSIVASLNYQPFNWFVNLTGIYGSGMSNGNTSGIPYQAGLFDFNVANKVAPAWIFNLSGGYSFYIGHGETLEPSLYVTNLLDHIHFVKGAYTTGAYWELPRQVVLKLSVHL